MRLHSVKKREIHCHAKFFFVKSSWFHGIFAKNGGNFHTVREKFRNFYTVISNLHICRNWFHIKICTMTRKTFFLDFEFVIRSFPKIDFTWKFSAFIHLTYLSKSSGSLPITEQIQSFVLSKLKLVNAWLKNERHSSASTGWRQLFSSESFTFNAYFTCNFTWMKSN